ncbi:MAG TPA: type II toxin-antitoxin system RelE/ParE family toxin [Pirellulales bacterium]|jgi:plasmid stabilization system protein ParE
MRLPLTLLDCAEADIAHAVSWYDRQVPGLGDSFYSHVARTLDAIEQFPASYQQDFGMVRRAITHRFPFAVYYRILTDTVQVVAILGCHLDPSAIRSRLTDEPRH